MTSQIWDSNLAEISHIVSIGNIMYTSYSIWLILTSIILLLAMVGVLVVVVKSPVSQVYAPVNTYKAANVKPSRVVSSANS